MYHCWLIWFYSILTPAQRKVCAHAIQNKGFHVLDAALKQVKSEEATAHDPEHVTVIRELILRYQGGFAALNDAVQVRLQSWFQTVAGISFANNRRLSEIGLDEMTRVPRSRSTEHRSLSDTALIVIHDYEEPCMHESANDGNCLVVEGTCIDGDDEELCIEPSNDDNHRSAKRAPSRRGSAIPLLSNFDETEI